MGKRCLFCANGARIGTLQASDGLFKRIRVLHRLTFDALRKGGLRPKMGMVPGRIPVRPLRGRLCYLLIFHLGGMLCFN